MARRTIAITRRKKPFPPERVAAFSGAACTPNLPVWVERGSMKKIHNAGSGGPHKGRCIW